MAATSTNLHQIGLSLHQRFRKDMDIHYPTSLSVKPRFLLPADSPQPAFMTKAFKKGIKKISRHRTQPLTFDEIKEVDEENLEDLQVPSKVLTSVDIRNTQRNLNIGTSSEMDKGRSKEQ